MQLKPSESLICGVRGVQRWFVQFRSGNSSLEDEPHGSQPCAFDNDQLKVLVETDPRKSVRALAEELNVDPSTVSRYLADIGKSKKLDKWVCLLYTSPNPRD